MHFRQQYSFLSNFYACDIEMEDGIIYPSVEHAYVASKTLNMGERVSVLNMTPGQAKRYGRTISIRPDWDTYRLEIMLVLLRKKFAIPSLAKKLLAIVEPIVEDNYWGDTFWGVCKGEGRNELGNLLMQVQDEILQDQLNDFMVRK